MSVNVVITSQLFGKMPNTVATLFVVILIAFHTAVDGFGSNLDKRRCPPFQIKKHTIIKTTASKANGAIYLGSSTVANSHGCFEACCDKVDCNLALLKFNEDTRVTCFLFNCGSPSKCIYHTQSSYRNYAALQFEDREVHDSLFSATRRYTLKETATEEVQTTPSYPDVARDRSTQHRWQSNIFKTTEENRDWYHHRDTMVPSTSSPNGDSQFDHTMKTNINDGSKHEFTNGRKSFTNESFVMTKAPATVNWHQGTKKETHYQGYDGSESTFDRSHEASDLGKVNYPKPGKDPEDESFERRVWPDNNPDYPNKPKSHFNKPRSTSTPTKASTKNPSTKKTETSFIINRFNIQQNKAVIPLAVGLVISLLLLLAVVFRMRTSRRRRTKAFLTDDADYLINGMYL